MSKGNVISLADRVLGRCPVCHEPVLFAENFIRTRGTFVHVRCTLLALRDGSDGRDFPRPAPSPVRGA
jgi:hypothetical protein